VARGVTFFNKLNSLLLHVIQKEGRGAGGTAGEDARAWRDDKTFKYELVSSGGGEKKDWRGGKAGEAHDPCSGFVQRARRGSESAFELFQGCEEEPER
jgi:hypothetical protein